MKALKIIMVAAAVLLAGCATTHLSGGSSLPANAKVVGGGLSIEWTAPTKGTVILVETDSGRMVRTQSVDEGDMFTFDPLAAENAEILNRMFGGPEAMEHPGLVPLPKDARFVLCFVP
jgi:hypothetical protein